MDLKECYIDTETTGTSPERHGIHQIAGEIWINNKFVENFDLRFRPQHGCEVEEEALKTGGLTIQDLIDRPMRAQDGYQSFNSLIQRFVDKYDKRDKFRFVGYNADFDWRMLQSFFKWNKDEYFGALFWYPPLDVAKEAFNCMSPQERANMKDFKLATLATLFNLGPKDGWHDAMVDIEATRLLHHFFAQRPRYSWVEHVPAPLRFGPAQCPVEGCGLPLTRAGDSGYACKNGHGF